MVATTNVNVSIPSELDAAILANKTEHFTSRRLRELGFHGGQQMAARADRYSREFTARNGHDVYQIIHNGRFFEGVKVVDADGLTDEIIDLADDNAKTPENVQVGHVCNVDLGRIILGKWTAQDHQDAINRFWFDPLFVVRQCYGDSVTLRVMWPTVWRNKFTGDSCPDLDLTGVPIELLRNVPDHTCESILASVIADNDADVALFYRRRMANA